jgi:Flp pilus assembly protein TadD
MKKPYLLIITAILYLLLTGGMSLANDTDIEREIEERKQAIRINPDDAKAHVLLGFIYDRAGIRRRLRR